MTTKRALLLVFAAVLVLLVGFFLWGPSRTPSGQEPLVTLSGNNFSQFEKAFDANADAARLILLLSPT